MVDSDPAKPRRLLLGQHRAALESVRIFVYGPNLELTELLAVEQLANFWARVRIPSLAPSFPEESVHPPDFCYGFAIKLPRGNPAHASPDAPRPPLRTGFSLATTSRSQTNYFSAFWLASPFRGSCCSVLIAARSCMAFPDLPTRRFKERPVLNRSQRPIKDL